MRGRSVGIPFALVAYDHGPASDNRVAEGCVEDRLHLFVSDHTDAGEWIRARGIAEPLREVPTRFGPGQTNAVPSLEQAPVGEVHHFLATAPTVRLRVESGSPGELSVGDCKN